MVSLSRGEVTGQCIDSLGQNGNLNFGCSGVLVVLSKLLGQRRNPLFRNRHISSLQQNSIRLLFNGNYFCADSHSIDNTLLRLIRRSVKTKNGRTNHVSPAAVTG
jgi:hypothetical protein